MTGVVTKKHFFMILKHFGMKKALQILVSRKPVALITLMS